MYGTQSDTGMHNLLRFRNNTPGKSVAFPKINLETPIFHCGPGNVVGIATGYGAGQSGDRIPVGARFSAPVQTGPGARPASCTMGTGSFPGAKRPGRDVDPSPPSSAVVKKE